MNFTDLWPPMWLSLRVAAAATVMVVLLGVPLAHALAHRRFKGKSVLEAIILLPLVLPPTVVGYAIIVLLGREGPLSAWLGGYSIALKVEGAILAAAVVAFPMAYLPAKAAFASIAREWRDTAKLMGAGPWQLFWHVSLPMAWRGVASGVVLAFARALGEFGATMMVFGWQPTRVTLPIAVYADWYDGSNTPRAAAAAVLLAIISLALMLVYNFAGRVERDV